LALTKADDDAFVPFTSFPTSECIAAASAKLQSSIQI